MRSAPQHLRETLASSLHPVTYVGLLAVSSMASRDLKNRRPYHEAGRSLIARLCYTSFQDVLPNPLQ